MKRLFDRKSFFPRVFYRFAVPCFNAVCVSFVIFACASAAIPWENEPVVNLCDSTVRLRVVANSAGEADTRVKLAVRDALLTHAPQLFGSCQSLESACLTLRTQLFSIERIAEKAVRDCGSGEPVRVHFGYERAPVRRYGSFTFPAGEYLTLRVDIGKADGRNWWCVLYPPLCLAGAQSDTCADPSAVLPDREVFLSYGFTEKQWDALQNATDENRKNEGKPRIRLALIGFFCKFAG